MPLTNKKVKSLSIEVNENFKEYYNNILNLMNKYEFHFLHKTYLLFPHNLTLHHLGEMQLLIFFRFS